MVIAIIQANGIHASNSEESLAFRQVDLLCLEQSPAETLSKKECPKSRVPSVEYHLLNTCHDSLVLTGFKFSLHQEIAFHTGYTIYPPVPSWLGLCEVKNMKVIC
jgi:hypothetical protein